MLMKPAAAAAAATNIKALQAVAASTAAAVDSDADCMATEVGNSF